MAEIDGEIFCNSERIERVNNSDRFDRFETNNNSDAGGELEAIDGKDVD